MRRQAAGGKSGFISTLEALLYLAAVGLMPNIIQADEIVVQNDSVIVNSSAFVLLADFRTGDQAGSRLAAPCDGRIIGVQIGWFGSLPTIILSTEEAIHIYEDGSFPVPGVELATIASPELMSFPMEQPTINEFRWLDVAQTDPLDVPVLLGDVIIVTLEFANATNIVIGGPNIVTDIDGCTADSNVLFSNVAQTWFDSCLFNAGDTVARLIVECPDPEPEFDSTPAVDSTIAFEDVFVTEVSADEIVKIDNLGDANLTVACALSGTGKDHFNIKACPGNVSPAGFVNIVVTCEPLSAGSKTASLDLTTNDSDEGSVSFDLTCNGVLLPPEFDSTPSPDSTIPFGEVFVTQTSGAETVRVDNLGDSNLTIACGLSGTNQSQFNVTNCPDTVSPDSFVEISVTCSPESAGPKLASLNLTTNDADESAVSYNLTCNGVLLPPEFDSTPSPDSTIPFGDVELTDPSDTQSIAVENLGVLALTLSCEITGSHADQFDATACPAEIIGGGTEDILMVCKPTSLGEKEAVLTVTTNDSDEPTNVYGLTCNGIPDNFIFGSSFEEM